MKKYINRFLLSGLLIGAALATTSCGEDYLETKPTESISDVSAIATVDNAYKALNGVAKTMTIQHGNYSQGFCGENCIMRLYENYPSQDYYYNQYASGWAPIHNQTYHTNRTSIYNHYAWYYYYQIITQANVIINRIDNAEGSEADRQGHQQRDQLHAKTALADISELKSLITVSQTTGDDAIYKRELPNIMEEYDNAYNELSDLSAQAQTRFRND